MIHFVRNDRDAAYRDIREVLAREPRHYLALAGLGGILRASGNVKGAYKAFTVRSKSIRIWRISRNSLSA